MQKKKNNQSISGRKKTIMAVASGFFLLLANAALAQWSTGTYAGYGLPTGSIYSIILGIMKWMLSIFGFIAIVGFVISGIMYLTAAGDEDQQKKAKKQMYWSITGVIVGSIGYLVCRLLLEKKKKKRQ